MENFFGQIQKLESKKYQETYKVVDMNKPENLQSFMSYLGVPRRKYQDIMEDLGLYVFERKKQEMFGQLVSEKEEIQRKYECLNQQLIDNGITPDDNYEHDPSLLLLQ